MDQWSRQQAAAGQQEPEQEEGAGGGATLAGEPSAGAGAASERAHHVGPVMGIFFKVWSLVKVSKVGRQQKLRRQHSDSAHHQFQYIPGAQAGNHCAHERHFRRAGSQPAPGPSHRLQVMSSSSSSANSAAAAQTPGTNSTSSGVSSAGSTSAGSTSGVRRHPSAQNLRRSAAEASAPTPPPPPPLPADGRAGSGGPKKPTTSWASRIRRSATSVNQADFSNYVSRYKFSAHRPQPAPPQAPSDRLRRLQLLSTGSSREEEDEEEEEEDGDGDGDDFEDHEEPTASDDGRDDHHDHQLGANFCRRRDRDRSRNHEEEDSQDNDIYSTPNDSIQSVPGGTAASQLQATAPPPPPPPGQRQPIVKSFSTSNFSSLLPRQQQQQQQQHLAGSPPLLSHSEEPEGPAARGADHSRPAPKRANLQGSRFFISSSSSEDSQSAKQHAALPNGAAGCLWPRQPPSVAGAGAGAFLEPQEEPSRARQRHLSPANPVALRPGIHYHAPVARSRQPAQSRPGSLLLLARAAADAGPALAQTPGYAQPLSTLAMLPGARAGWARPPTSAGLQAGGRAQQAPSRVAMLPNSVSLHDCNCPNTEKGAEASDEPSAEYRLAQMLLESGARANAKDSAGHTALMLAVMSDNLAAARCLLERRADLDETNQLGLSALDLACQRPPTRQRLDMLLLLVEAGAQLDRCSSASPSSAPSRLLDRLIRQHRQPHSDKLPYIDLLLQAGAKLGSSTWLEAHNKQDVQLRLLKKLCQDGYFLYKKGSIEAAVFRFEYALKRVAELEQQLAQQQHHHHGHLNHYLAHHQLAHHQLANHHHHHHHLNRLIPVAARQIKYQTYLGLSRCERKRRFYKRALEFAHLAILVDSTSYEGFYSKAHILKDLGELDDALLAIYQTARLVEESAELVRLELRQLEQQEESLVFSYGYEANLLPGGEAGGASRFESARAELAGNLEYLEEAKRFIGKLKAEILEDKLARSGESPATTNHQESSALT